MTRTKSLRAKYNEEVKAALKEKFGYKNDMMIPKLHKIVLNMGVGEASHNSKIADAIQAQLTKIAGQKAMVTKAKKSIAKGPNDPHVNILYSNILFYMPGIFGGDTEKALQGYKKALQTMEADPELKKNNWMYIQLMVTIGVVEEKRENYVEAQKMYRKVLELYPEYAHVKNVSYPRLLEKMKG